MSKRMMSVNSLINEGMNEIHDGMYAREQRLRDLHSEVEHVHNMACLGVSGHFRALEEAYRHDGWECAKAAATLVEWQGRGSLPALASPGRGVGPAEAEVMAEGQMGDLRDDARVSRLQAEIEKLQRGEHSIFSL